LWGTHDTTECVDYAKAVSVRFPSLKLTGRTISIRVPESLLHDIKVTANQAGAPSQSMMKILLTERVTEIRQGRKRRVRAA
jgi:predicted DNA binding CopG/RHH family protein